MWHKIIGGVLLITGVSVGAGMLVLPIYTGAYGFQSSVVLLFGCWFVMTLSAYFMLEVSLWMPLHTNLTTMLRKTLSLPMQIIVWFAYLILLYALMTVYFEGLGGILSEFFRNTFHLHLPYWSVVLFTAVLFMVFIQAGAKAVEPLNRFLIIFMLGIFIVLVSSITHHVNVRMFEHPYHWQIWYVMSLGIAAFSYHVIIPSLRDYLGGNIKALRITIFLGGLIPLVMYLVWEAVVLGIIPMQGKLGLNVLAEYHATAPVLARVLSHLLNQPGFSIGFRLFSFFAISTSALGFGLAIYDFLADAMFTRKSITSQIVVPVLAFMPPFLFATYFPGRFEKLLEYSGFFSTLLFVFLPALMVWRGRYYTYIPSNYRVCGGRLMLLIPTLVTVAVVVFQFFSFIR
ncbi:MAG: hypothetical protein KKE46_01345 [Gammaproteobacteria bacterium]|nr:hypothetical protein [Gammaproteobacteria bacterium]MBU2545763.1 hypothetical protein [Gammaproteobacteria bacterium]